MGPISTLSESQFLYLQHMFVVRIKGVYYIKHVAWGLLECVSLRYIVITMK